MARFEWDRMMPVVAAERAAGPRTALDRLADGMAADLLSDREFVDDARALLRAAFARARRQLEGRVIDRQK